MTEWKTDQYGPVYSVRLLESLPIGHGMRQQLPNEQDLDQVREINERVAAGYEVVLCHYQDLRHRQQRDMEEIERLKAIIRSVARGRRWSATDLQEAIGDI